MLYRFRTALLAYFIFFIYFGFAQQSFAYGPFIIDRHSDGYCYIVIRRGSTGWVGADTCFTNWHLGKDINFSGPNTTWPAHNGRLCGKEISGSKITGGISIFYTDKLQSWRLATIAVAI